MIDTILILFGESARGHKPQGLLFLSWPRISRAGSARDDCGDLWFQAENDQHIVRLAMVGEKKWEELSLMFTAEGMRPFPIEYLTTNEEALARAWLEG